MIDFSAYAPNCPSCERSSKTVRLDFVSGGCGVSTFGCSSCGRTFEQCGGNINPGFLKLRYTGEGYKPPELNSGEKTNEPSFGVCIG